MKEVNTDLIERTMVGAIRKVNSWDGTNAPLRWLLYDLTDEWSERLKDIQAMEYHSNEQVEAKNSVPRFYISGAYDFTIKDRFPIYNKPVVKSNLMTVDIDEKDNQHIDIWSIREKIFELPYVYSCLKSISGHGYYVIMPIEDTDFTKQYYNYIIKLWKQKYGVNCDEKANTLVRARIISYDAERDKWIKRNQNVKIWSLKDNEKEIDNLLDHRNQPTLFDYKITLNTNDDMMDVMTNKAMEMMIDSGYYAKNYNAWYHLGAELKNFDNGWELFLKSSLNSNYDDDETTIKKKWDQITASGIDNDLRRKWMGMAKNKFGTYWYKMHS